MSESGDSSSIAISDSEEEEESYSFAASSASEPLSRPYRDAAVATATPTSILIREGSSGLSLTSDPPSPTLFRGQQGPTQVPASTASARVVSAPAPVRTAATVVPSRNAGTGTPPIRYANDVDDDDGERRGYVVRGVSGRQPPQQPAQPARGSYPSNARGGGVMPSFSGSQGRGPYGYGVGPTRGRGATASYSGFPPAGMSTSAGSGVGVGVGPAQPAGMGGGRGGGPYGGAGVGPGMLNQFGGGMPSGYEDDDYSYEDEDFMFGMYPPGMGGPPGMPMSAPHGPYSAGMGVSPGQPVNMPYSQQQQQQLQFGQQLGGGAAGGGGSAPAPVFSTTPPRESGVAALLAGARAASEASANSNASTNTNTSTNTNVNINTTPPPGGVSGPPVSSSSNVGGGDVADDITERALARQRERYESQMRQMAAQQEAAMQQMQHVGQFGGMGGGSGETGTVDISPQQLHAMHIEYAALRSRCMGLERELMNLYEHQGAMMSNMAAELKAKFEEERSVLRKEIASLRERRELHASETHGELQALQQRYDEDAVAWARERAQLSGGHVVAGSLAKQLGERDERIAALEAELASAKRPVVGGEAATRILELERENEQLRKNYDELKRVHDYFSESPPNQNPGMQRRINELLAAKDESDARAKELQETVDDLVSGGADLDAAKLHAELDKMRERMSVLKIKYDREAEHARQLRKDATSAASRAEIDELTTLVGYLREEVNFLRDENKELTTRLAATGAVVDLPQRQIRAGSQSEPFIPRPVSPPVRHALLPQRHAHTSSIAFEDSGDDFEGVAFTPSPSLENQPAQPAAGVGSGTRASPGPGHTRRNHPLNNSLTSMDGEEAANSKQRYAEWLMNSRHA